MCIRDSRCIMRRFSGSYVNCQYPGIVAPPSARRDVLPADTGPVPSTTNRGHTDIMYTYQLNNQIADVYTPKPWTHNTYIVKTYLVHTQIVNTCVPKSWPHTHPNDQNHGTQHTLKITDTSPNNRGDTPQSWTYIRRQTV